MRRRDEAGQEPHRGGLARAVGSEKGDDLASGNFEADVANGEKRPKLFEKRLRFDHQRFGHAGEFLLKRPNNIRKHFRPEASEEGRARRDVEETEVKREGTKPLTPSRTLGWIIHPRSFQGLRLCLDDTTVATASTHRANLCDTSDVKRRFARHAKRARSAKPIPTRRNLSLWGFFRAGSLVGSLDRRDERKSETHP